MPDEITLHDLDQALVELDDEAAVDLTGRLLRRLVEPVDILTTCEKALTTIGERYAEGEYFISGLIMAGEVMSRITELVTPHLVTPRARVRRGRALIGTVEGDIHDLGKNIAGALLSAHGFTVLDLGVDVPSSDFVKESLKFKPDVVGLSALLTICFPALQTTIAALRKIRGSKSRPVILISGAQVTGEHLRLYKADLQARTAFDTVRLCEQVTP
jgi:5-methyltetrahydrofolate--homocysteine methyltransferase